MQLNTEITILAQMGEKQFSETGIESDGLLVAGINHELGLLVLAAADEESYKQNSAYKAIEIMMDDMSFNLSVNAGNSGKITSAVTQCMHESIDNINEYLFSQFQASALSSDMGGVDLSAIQIQQNVISCCQLGEIQGFKFSDNQLSKLGAAEQDKLRLGTHNSLTVNIVEHGIRQGDILILTTEQVMTKIGEEFIRVTTSRFSDNLEMLLRQLNTRALHNGLEQNPVIILCRIERSQTQKSGWLSRFGK